MHVKQVTKLLKKFTGIYNINLVKLEGERVHTQNAVPYAATCW